MADRNSLLYVPRQAIGKLALLLLAVAAAVQHGNASRIDSGCSCVIELTETDGRLLR